MRDEKANVLNRRRSDRLRVADVFGAEQQPAKVIEMIGVWTRSGGPFRTGDYTC